MYSMLVRDIGGLFLEILGDCFGTSMILVFRSRKSGVRGKQISLHKALLMSS